MQRTVRRVGVRCSRTGVRPLIEVSAPHHHSNCPYNEPFHPDEWTRVYFSSHDLLLSFHRVFSFACAANTTTNLVYLVSLASAFGPAIDYPKRAERLVVRDPPRSDVSRSGSTNIGVFFARGNPFSFSTSRREKFRD